MPTTAYRASGPTIARWTVGGGVRSWRAPGTRAGGDAVLLHGRRRPVHLVEVPVPERAAIVRRYLLVAWGARPHMSITWRSSLREVAAAAADYPVFRVERRRP